MQTFTIDGSAGFSGAVYAPNGNTTFTGTGDILGAVVCNQAYLTGTSNFHYDIALSKPNGKSPITYPANLGGTPTKYRELDNPADQAPYNQYVNE
jgi:hypothetical protein